MKAIIIESAEAITFTVCLYYYFFVCQSLSHLEVLMQKKHVRDFALKDDIRWYISIYPSIYHNISFEIFVRREKRAEGGWKKLYIHGCRSKCQRGVARFETETFLI